MTTGASWTITASPTTVVVHPGESAAVRFTVTNNTTAPPQRHGTIAVLPSPGTDSWFDIDQDTRTFTPGGSSDFTVTVRPAPTGTTGTYPFSCLVYDTDHPTVDTTVQSSPVTVTFAPMPWAITASTSVVRLADTILPRGEIGFQVSGPVGSQVKVRVRPIDGPPADARWFTMPFLPQTIGDSGTAAFDVPVRSPNPLGSVVPRTTFVGDLVEMMGDAPLFRASSGTFRIEFEPDPHPL
ncbi:hypothetical protein [Kitasatospora sp. NPDC087314]|uniref:hypothetical protein n=1 Tax=Kitasatospora sp. NPDC087314 TaxID=3364068 RepID=UPI0038159F50